MMATKYKDSGIPWKVRGEKLEVRGEIYFL